MNVIVLFMLSVLGTVLLLALLAGAIIFASSRRARRDQEAVEPGSPLADTAAPPAASVSDLR